VVLVALLLVGLIAMLALVLDGGNMYLQRRRVQNAADAAALAAASRLADEWNDTAIQATVTEYAVTRNGADTVDAVYLPSEEAVGGGYVPANSTGVRVHATRTVSTFFAGVVGLQESTIVADAAAQFELLSGGCGGYGFWAQSETCSEPVEWSGSGGLIIGRGHSNGKMKVSGSGHEVQGDVEYVTTVQETGSGHDITYVQSTASDSFPIQWNIEDYRPEPLGVAASAAQAEGKYFVHDCDTWQISGSETFDEGLHYCTGKVSISGSGHYGHITIVAEEQIQISGSGHIFEYYCDGLLFFSNYEPSGQCTSAVVDVSGSGGRYEGVIYAPHGLIQYTGSGHHMMYGALIGWCVDLSGSSFTLTYNDEICEDMAKKVTVRLIQ